MTSPRHEQRTSHLRCIVTLALLSALSAPLLGGETLQPCEMGERSPHAAAELDQFAFLIGNYDIKARLWVAQQNRWSTGFRPAYWEGRWILDGHAIADYWYDTPPTGLGDPPGRGVNVRLYRPETKQWLNMWQHTGLAEVRTLTSEVRADGLMHMWASHPDTSTVRRMHFVVSSPDFWYRVEERSNDGGKTWQPATRLDAHRAPCPWKGPAQ